MISNLEIEGSAGPEPLPIEVETELTARMRKAIDIFFQKMEEFKGSGVERLVPSLGMLMSAEGPEERLMRVRILMSIAFQGVDDSEAMVRTCVSTITDRNTPVPTMIHAVTVMYFWFSSGEGPAIKTAQHVLEKLCTLLRALTTPPKES